MGLGQRDVGVAGEAYETSESLRFFGASVMTDAFVSKMSGRGRAGIP